MFAGGKWAVACMGRGLTVEVTGHRWRRRWRSAPSFYLPLAKMTLLMNFNLLHLMYGALCCSQSATAPLDPLQTYSTVDGLFTDGSFEVKSSRRDQPEEKEQKQFRSIGNIFHPLKLNLPLNPPGVV